MGEREEAPATIKGLEQLRHELEDCIEMIGIARFSEKPKLGEERQAMAVAGD